MKKKHQNQSSNYSQSSNIKMTSSASILNKNFNLER